MVILSSFPCNPPSGAFDATVVRSPSGTSNVLEATRHLLSCSSSPEKRHHTPSFRLGRSRNGDRRPVPSRAPSPWHLSETRKRPQHVPSVVGVVDGRAAAHICVGQRRHYSPSRSDAIIRLRRCQQRSMSTSSSCSSSHWRRSSGGLSSLLICPTFRDGAAAPLSSQDDVRSHLGIVQRGIGEACHVEDGLPCMWSIPQKGETHTWTVSV